MLFVAPAGFMRGNVFFCALLEGDRLRSVEACLLPLGASRIDWIDAIVTLTTAIRCTGSRISKADGVYRSDPHPPRAPIQHEPKDPILGPVCRDAQIKPAPITIHTRLLRFFDLEHREPADCPRH